MAFFALLWKARTIEKYRLNYEKEKINSITLGHTQMEQTLSQRWRHYRLDTKKRISRTFKKWYPDGSGVSNFFLYLRTDQTFPNFLLKSVMGFVGGIILTYLCFMFFVFQLSISLIHATIMSSIIGVLLTLGLAFSYRIRCLVFLLIPQFFSRVGRYTLTCYALVLILTGPATNTLRNSEVLSESMACSQEQIKTSVHQINDLLKKPINGLKDSIKLMVDRLKMITAKVKETIVRLDRLVLSIVSIIQSSFAWLQSIVDICNDTLGTPYERCTSAMEAGITECKKNMGPEISGLCNVALVAQAACYSVKPFKTFCYATDFMDESIMASIKKKLRNFTEYLRAMFHVEIHIHHSYSYSSNTSRSASQVAAGIVTEIRNRADPLLTWLSWSSCVTSLFLLLIIFRAKYYQHMYETRSRFDNRYVTKELQELDLKRQQQGRETVLPLNRRERAKYITTTSFRLVASEKVYLNRSAVFMAITTFKLLIHMVADYSLYWVLMTIRYHGKYQSDMMPGVPHSGVHISGTGFVARLFRSIVGVLDIPLSTPASSPITCLPDPYPPDLRRYTQIGVLIFLLWLFALFEPYGLRLRHLIMGHYRPERAKARATWLYNHILRTRASFMKFARRKLHREYKYSSEAHHTFRQWITNLVPFQCLRSLLGLGPKESHCLLCGTTKRADDPDTELTRCQTPACPGVFCVSCFTDIGAMCTICLSPADYGDLSDVSPEKGSSDDSDTDDDMIEGRPSENVMTFRYSTSDSDRSARNNERDRWNFFTKTTGPGGPFDEIALLTTNKYEDCFINAFRKIFKEIKSSIKIRCWDKKYTSDWVAKLNPQNMYKEFSNEENYNFYSNSLDIEQYGEFDEVLKRTKSVGVNTDRNRSAIINMLVNSFKRQKLKQRHNKTTNKGKLQNQKLGTIKHVRPQIEYNIPKINKTSFISFKTISTHNLPIRQRNLKKIARSRKDCATRHKIKLNTNLNGIIKSTKYLLKGGNNVINKTNQNNDSVIPNNPPIGNGKENKPSNNADRTGKEKRKMKKSAKKNKPTKPRKAKNDEDKTIKSRSRIAEFHTFVDNQWNNFKYTLMPCTAPNQSVSPIVKEKRNHKRRKKLKKSFDFNDTDESLARKDNKHTRNLRISAFLAELDWTKRDYEKADNVHENDSFFVTDKAPVPVHTNKIVGMVQLKSIPFQWREAKLETCNCEDKYCTCTRQSEKCLRIFGPMSKLVTERVNAKKALERFRSKVNTISPPSSLVQKLMSNVNASRLKGSSAHESSICLSKRASFYRPFTKEFTDQTECFSTDMLFKNENFDAKLEDSEIIGETLKFSSALIVSHSSQTKINPRVTKRCKCEMYGGLQKKWAHVKKSVSDSCRVKGAISKMKYFCSSLFGPACNVESCPNVTDKTKKSSSKPRKDSKSEKSQKSKGHTTQTDNKSERKKKKAHAIKIQTQSKKSNHTQLTESTNVEKEIARAREKARKRIDRDKEALKNLCEVEKEKLDECMKKEKERLLEEEMEKLALERQAREKQAQDGLDVDKQGSDEPQKADKEVSAEPEMASGACQAIDCPNYCHTGIQYDKKDAREARKQMKKKKEKKRQTKGVGSAICYCDRNKETKGVGSAICCCDTDEAVQGTPYAVCTCATQHVSPPCSSSGNLRRKKASLVVVSSAVLNEKLSVKDKEIQNEGLSLSSLPKQNSTEIRSTHEIDDTQQEIITDTETDSTTSSNSLRSDETRTDTTICSLATFDYDESLRRRKYRVKVVTKANQATLTDKARLCDTGTITDDWWSPIVERKANDAIILEKKKGFNTIEKQKLRELRDWKELREMAKRRRNCGVTTDGRIVTFRSKTQIIPTGLFSRTNDIMSPSRYLLESQKYYNELFAYNIRPPILDYNCVTQSPKCQEKMRSPIGSRRNHHRKTKTLEDVYSPRKQISHIRPRRKKNVEESARTSDSLRRKSYTHRYSSNRYPSKYYSPRKPREHKYEKIN